MISLVTVVNRTREEKQRQFFFKDTVNETCQYDPSRYEDDYDTFTSTKDILIIHKKFCDTFETVFTVSL